jgi:hypothetical protein
LLSRWVNLETGKKQQLNKLFALNRRVLKARPSRTAASAKTESGKRRFFGRVLRG